MFTVMKYKGIGSFDSAVFKTADLVNANVNFTLDFVPVGKVIPISSGMNKKQADKKLKAMLSKVA